jgi:CBS domain-containing protein
MQVKDLMTRDVVTVAPHTSLKETARLLVERGISGVPVVDEDGSVLGVVSEDDILIKEHGEAVDMGLVDGLFHRAERQAEKAKAEAVTAGDAMSPAPPAIEVWHSVPYASSEMLAAGTERLLVMQRSELVGIITRSDLVRAFARGDVEIAQEIRESMGELTVPSGIDVDVRDGEVVLHGKVDNRLDAESLPSIVRRTPGVVAVHADLAYYDPDEMREVAVSASVN